MDGHVPDSGNPHNFPAGIEQIVAGRDAQRDVGNRRVRRRGRVSWRGRLRGSRRRNRRRRACRHGCGRKCRGRHGGQCRRRRVRWRGSSGGRRRIRWHRRGCGCRRLSGTDYDRIGEDNGFIAEFYPNSDLIIRAVGQIYIDPIFRIFVVLNDGVDSEVAFVSILTISWLAERYTHLLISPPIRRRFLTPLNGLVPEGRIV